MILICPIKVVIFKRMGCDMHMSIKVYVKVVDVFYFHIDERVVVVDRSFMTELTLESL